MEGHIAARAVQNREHEVQAAEQVKFVVCLPACDVLNHLAGLDFDEALELSVQMFCPVDGGLRQPTKQIGLVVPSALLLIVLHLASKGFMGGLKLTLEFSSVGWPSSSRGS